jgi:hypothetical protein
MEDFYILRHSISRTTQRDLVMFMMLNIIHSVMNLKEPEFKTGPAQTMTNKGLVRFPESKA